MKLSIIVPVYNVEQYIRPCVESIFRQSLVDDVFEVILVDDGTPDNSFGVIRDVLDKHDNIQVVKQQNQGLSAARNTGLSKAKGDYILFVDSDDLLIDNMLPSLLSYTDKSPDLVVAEFLKMTNEEIDRFQVGALEGHSAKEKSGEVLFQEDLNPQQCYVWRTLYRKAFLDMYELRFIPGIYFEDVPFTTECYLKAATCVKTSLVFYIYRQRENSIVSSINLKKVMDFNVVLERLWYIKDSYTLSYDTHKKLLDVIFTTFSILVWYVSHNSSLLAQRREIMSDLKRRVPNLYFENGIKQKCISLLYHYCPNLYIRLRAI